MSKVKIEDKLKQKAIEVPERIAAILLTNPERYHKSDKLPTPKKKKTAK